MALKVLQCLTSWSRLFSASITCLGQKTRAFSAFAPGYSQILSGPILPKSLQVNCGGLHQSVLRAGFTSQNAIQVRHYKSMYKPNVYRRMKKHGLKKMLSTRKGKIVIWRRVLKGRHSVSLPSIPSP